MKTPPLTKEQGGAVVSGGNHGPFGGYPVLLPAVTLGAIFAYPPNWRGLALAPFFGVKINNIGRPFAHQCRAGVFFLPRIRPALLKVLHQISYNLFKAFHKFIPFFTSKSSSGEKQWDYKNQTMRLSK